MAADALLMVGSASAVCGIGALRIAWSRPSRSRLWVAAGWGLLLLAALLAAWAQGAWGLAIASLCAMSAAAVLMAHAAIRAPAASGVRALDRRAGMLPDGRAPLHLGRRIMTVLIVGVLAMLVAAGCGVAIRSAAVALGASQANAIVTGLFAMPLIWCGLAYALLMAPRRLAQWRLLALCAVPGVIAIMAGQMA